jgi:hypothetical protein
MSDVHAIADRLELGALRGDQSRSRGINTAEMAGRLMAALWTEDPDDLRDDQASPVFRPPEIVCRTSLLHVETCLVTPPTSPGDHR